MRKDKKARYHAFIADYRHACQVYIDHIWSTYGINNQHYDVPKFISTTDIPLTTQLSARALKCAATQAAGIVKAQLKMLSTLFHL
jgi:hypothetical protein